MSLTSNPTPLETVKAIKSLEIEKLSTSLGSAYASKILVTDSDGDVAVSDVSDLSGTLNTTSTDSLSTSADENLSGNIQLHSVSKTGSYNSLNDKPINVSNFNNDSGYLTENDLSGFAKSNEIPTNNNQLTNGAGYITGENVAKTNQNNNFSAAQTFNGDITVNGNITQNGSAYKTYTEEIYTKKDYIILREGATGGLSNNSYCGLQATKYDGQTDGRLAFGSDGVARVGDVGDEQPIATREETLTNGATVKWDANNLKLVSGLAFVVCTSAQYESSSKDSNTIYFITD